MNTKLNRNYIVPPTGPNAEPLFHILDCVVTDRQGVKVHDGSLVVANLEGYAIVPCVDWDKALLDLTILRREVAELRAKRGKLTKVLNTKHQKP